VFFLDFRRRHVTTATTQFSGNYGATDAQESAPRAALSQIAAVTESGCPADGEHRRAQRQPHPICRPAASTPACSSKFLYDQPPKAIRQMAQPFRYGQPHGGGQASAMVSLDCIYLMFEADHENCHLMFETEPSNCCLMFYAEHITLIIFYFYIEMLTACELSMLKYILNPQIS
jgi:hypothetical protein